MVASRRDEELKIALDNVNYNAVWIPTLKKDGRSRSRLQSSGENSDTSTIKYLKNGVLGGL